MVGLGLRPCALPPGDGLSRVAHNPNRVHSSRVVASKRHLDLCKREPLQQFMDACQVCGNTLATIHRHDSISGQNLLIRVAGHSLFDLIGVHHVPHGSNMKGRSLRQLQPHEAGLSALGNRWM